MTPDSWLEEFFGNEFFSGNFDHLKSIITRLDLKPAKEQKIITIAGTNGKGQTARLLSKLFHQNNRSAMLLTSPHLKKVNERFVIDEEDVSDEKLLSHFKDIHSKTQEESLSYFEFLYLVFLSLVKDLAPEFVIQEVGLGGRLDACNAIDADISCVTSISRDHQALLGNSYKKILLEKLGVARANKPLITALELGFLRSVSREFSQELACEWTDLFDNQSLKTTDHFSKRNHIMAENLYFHATGEKRKVESAVSHLAKRKSLRFGEASYDLFPTHNVDGLRKLVQFLSLEQYNNYDLVLFAPSRREESDLISMCKILRHCFRDSELKLVHFEHIKALEFARLKELEKKFGYSIVKDIEKDKSNSQSQRVLVLGSNYFLGEFLSRLPCTEE